MTAQILQVRRFLRHKMAFGNIRKEEAPAPAAQKEEEKKPAEAKDGESLGGWNNMWGALAAREGIVDNINPNIYGEVLADGCALMMKNLPPASRLTEDSVVYDLGSGIVCFVCVWSMTWAQTTWLCAVVVIH